MSLTVKHLNSDASFLLAFRPMIPFPPSEEDERHSFTILLDPWISGPSKILHSKFSQTRQKEPACIASLTELPEPDLIIISQPKSDHCHKETLTRLPKHAGKTRILAEPAAAKAIKSWRYFEPEMIDVLPNWEQSRSHTTVRIPIPKISPDGELGEVTIACLPQKGDYTGLHGAIGITYRSPTYTSSSDSMPLTPPYSPASPTFSNPPSNQAKVLSIIFSPHGCSYKTLSRYASTHLKTQSALPLTALLHCFDKVTNAWWLGGNICSGFPGGLEIAQKLSAKAWISAHDGDKDVSGFANQRLTIEKFEREEVENVISPKSAVFPLECRTGTEAVVLGVGEEIHLC